MSFDIPPQLTGPQGRKRRAGFELEFAGVSPEDAARITADVFGGSVRPESRFHLRVRDAGVGDFSVELDAVILKQKRYEGYLENLGIRLDQKDRDRLEDVVSDLSAALVPCEIVSPPLPLDGLEPLEELRDRLRREKARGTKTNPAYAFGLHINLEPPDLEADTIRRFMQAYVLLEPWLRKMEELDLSRILSPYIDSFPGDYARLILASEYEPDLARFMDDYLRLNPTRNRSLDLLPLLAHLDEDRVMAAEVERHLIKPRPAWHYRLPNCRVDEPQWRVADAYNRFLLVEKLAGKTDLLEGMAADWRDTPGFPLDLFTTDWTKKAGKWVKRAL